MDFEAYIDLPDTLAEFGPVTDKSKVFTTCPSCKKQRITTFRCVKRAVRSFGNCLCAECRRSEATPISESSRDRWQDPEYRKRQASGCIRYWAEPEAKERQSLRSRKMWATPHHRLVMSEIMLDKHQDDQFSAKFKEAMCQLWSDDEFRKRITASNAKNAPLLSKFMLERWQSDWGAEMRQKLASSVDRDRKRQRALSLWSDPEYRSRQNTGFRQVLQSLLEDPADRQKLSDAGKRPWKDEKFRTDFSKMRSEFLSGKRRSSLELVTGNLLDSMGIRYQEQVAIGPYVLDFILPDHGVVIEVQGEYWHARPKAERADASKFSYTEKARPDLKILYLHERDFLNPACIRQKLSQVIYGTLDSVNFNDFDFSHIVTRNVEVSAARQFLSSFHYGQFGRAAKHICGAFLDDELIAVCKFSAPIRKEVATSMGLSFGQVLELDRMCIHPNRHKKNFASWFISRCCKTIFSVYPKVETLVSFADATYGHRGTIYMSCGWTQVSVIAPDYFYVNQDGWMMHKKTLYGHASRMGMRERDYAEKFGYNRVMGKEKTKFRLDRPIRRIFLDPEHI